MFEKEEEYAKYDYEEERACAHEQESIDYQLPGHRSRYSTRFAEISVRSLEAIDRVLYRLALAMQILQDEMTRLFGVEDRSVAVLQSLVHLHETQLVVILIERHACGRCDYQI